MIALVSTQTSLPASSLDQPDLRQPDLRPNLCLHLTVYWQKTDLVEYLQTQITNIRLQNSIAKTSIVAGTTSIDHYQYNTTTPIQHHYPNTTPLPQYNTTTPIQHHYPNTTPLPDATKKPQIAQKNDTP